MDTRELAWAAGLFEGEGTIAVGNALTRNGRSQPHIALTMTDEDTVRRFVDVVGIGAVHRYEPQGPRRKPTYRWWAGSLEGVQHVICLLWYGLGERRRTQARETMRIVLETRALPHKPRKRPTHCKHGHEFTPENTYTWVRDGSRACRECTRGRRTARAA